MKRRVLFAAALAGTANTTQAQDKADGATLYRQNCAACHGTNPEGQSGPGRLAANAAA
ncbi:c-type cytochrome [Salipiger aestuarii]|uniref:Cbb3-type cytochrome c oxidase subunit III n=1 Tax=Salipiger aestuarii TaxID=568098 RepID=A0A327XJI8_9RHOB|nr:c-type cytochrome [Salipiger aestuarii]EIE51563.1 hypothetical protein C357_07886 [Citreicella sp. 357]RAK08542.1 cbb3-type cytochrome c oxidase subunit III [Salipiger aestuarii]